MWRSLGGGRRPRHALHADVPFGQLRRFTTLSTVAAAITRVALQRPPLHVARPVVSIQDMRSDERCSRGGSYRAVFRTIS
jgi:hypothetical protein